MPGMPHPSTRLILGGLAAALVAALATALCVTASATPPAVQPAAVAGVASWPAAATDVAATPRPGMAGTALPLPVNMPKDPRKAAMVRRGFFLVVAGDCLPCHSVAGEPAFAGGRAVGTPFGTVFSPNITPSKRFGIGAWTDRQFWRAMHDGIEPGSSLVVFPKYEYPVMPYTAYSKLSHADVMAIKAYLDTLAPAAIPDRPDTMAFPADLRAGLLAWRLMFFHPHAMKYQPGWSRNVRHGAYLVQALEHCSACHTPRNLAMATIPSRQLAGGHIIDQGWYAPNITDSKSDGIGAWSRRALLAYLREDGDMRQGAPFGKMKTVVDDSLSRLPKRDVNDIVDYLRTVHPQQSASAGPVLAASLARGKHLYHAECARCHGDDGRGVTANIPNLAHNEAVWNGPADDLVSMVLGGFQPWHPGQSSMPRFGAMLSDAQIAAIANYVRTSWGNRGIADATANTVAALRPLKTIEVDLDTGSMTATLSQGGKARRFTDISGRIWIDGNRTDCRMTASLSAQYGRRPVRLAGACAAQGNRLIGRATIGGDTHPMTLDLRQVYRHDRLVAVALTGGLGGGRKLAARIALSTANY
ncbi:cytochrome c [Acidiphilium sp. C61]|uniref:c-type cytochrome n=1 Tax=Acidiphilium sp. C61 TaxID=1671485 RepID=UPI00157B0073|nr:cytochrome c [Acidiphilium sp. C61]